MATNQTATKTPKSVIADARKQGAKMVDVKFVDTFGTWQHFSVPIAELTEEVFEEGFGFDGSSIRGWKSIEASDMLAMPDPASAFIDPFCAVPTLSVTCTIAETGTKEAYNRDPRGISQRAEQYLKSTGLADTAVFGPEAEFFIFDNVQFDHKSNGTFYSVDSEEALWNTGRDEMPNLGYKIRHKEGYFPVGPLDTQQDIRTEMCLTMEQLGVRIERQHHEVATAGQAEIDYRFESLVRAGNDYAGLSPMALNYIGGLLKHARALCAVCNPTTNSYKRLVPGYEAPVNLAYSSRNRSAAIRIPTYSESPKAKRIEYRPPDPAANPYLCYSALLMAGLDGVLNKIEPGEPMDKNLYELPPEEHAKIPQVPGSLGEALDLLENDHDFLLKGDVFTS